MRHQFNGVGGLYLVFLGRGAGSPFNTILLGSRLETHLPTKWHRDPSSHLALTDIVQKLGCVSFWGGAWLLI